ncbi:MAG: PQQ-binding-like beta-propeller repeat protein [Planctomycetota bacterium]|nr:PQQ-binding-like beta-propeller repeat protein [Planctomycetota bacterium]
MAGGPDGDWTVTGPQPPLNFSVRTKHNILWKTSLPEGGQSGIAIHGEMAFLSIMKPWTPKHDPDHLKAELNNINQQKKQIRDAVDKELFDSNTNFAAINSHYKNNEKQIDELISQRVEMLLAEDPNQNVTKLRDRVRRFHPKVKELEVEQRRLTSQMDRVRISHSMDYAAIQKANSDIEKKIRELPSLKGTDIVAYCLDANTGEFRWSTPLTGSVEGPYNYGFSDSSSPTPITDGKYVWFVNASGAMGCWSVEGKKIWYREWTPSAKAPFNKQYEPILTGDWILNVEPLPEDDPRRSQEGERRWNYLRAIDKQTGKTVWIAEDAITHYNTPILGTLDGLP